MGTTHPWLGLHPQDTPWKHPQVTPLPEVVAGTVASLPSMVRRGGQLPLAREAYLHTTPRLLELAPRTQRI